LTGQNIVVVGASWGGLSALTQLVSAIPDEFPAPIILVQHRSRHADSLLASLLQDATKLRVVDVEDKEPLDPATVYVAPANYHLLVEETHLSLSTDPMEKFSRPSIDVTFVSAADEYRSRAIGVVLTGANDDGSKGLRRIVNLGGRAIVQDPATAESKVMPAAALRAVPEAEILSLEKIPPRLVEMTKTEAQKKSGMIA
jgi:two-component system chemotaxis response regulator CheB